jgi:hypothetical protein
VLFTPFSGGAPVGQHADKRSLCCFGIWQNKKRNRQIAELAHALATGNMLPVRYLSERDQAFLSSLGPSPRVGVLVANVEQAYHIHQQLPGWKLIPGSPVNLGGLTRAQAEAIRVGLRQPNRPEKGIIVTPMGLKRVRTCDVLLRADGGTGPLASHWAKENTGDGVFKRQLVIIVDCWDRHHPELRRHSRKRLAAYLQQGWRMPGKFPTELDQFVHARRNMGSIA